MKIKMLSSVAGADFSVNSGEIVEADFVGGDETAKAWIANGVAIEAPSAEDAAQQLAEMWEQLDAVTKERDGYKALIADARSVQAAAEAERDGYKAKLDKLLKSTKAPPPPA